MNDLGNRVYDYVCVRMCVCVCSFVLSNKMNVWYLSIYDSMPGSNLVVTQTNSSHYIAIQHMCVYALKISFERQAVLNIQHLLFILIGIVFVLSSYYEFVFVAETTFIQ